MEMQPIYRTIEEMNRVEALQNAVRHRIKEEKADDVVKSAEKYFAFLQGKTAEK